MSYLLDLLTQCGIYIILCMSLNLIMGYGGMTHLGHGGLFAVGAYVSALCFVHLGLPFFVEMLLAALVTTVFGLLIAFPAIRLKDDYLAFTTCGFALVIYAIANNWMKVTNGPIGIPNISYPTIFGFKFRGWYYLIIVAFFTLLIFFLIRRIVNAPFGRTIESIREDETASLACGRDINKIKATIFCVGAFFAGIAGTLYVHYLGIADPTSFTSTVSFTLMSMILIGGSGSLSGPIVGAALVVLLPQLLKFLGLPNFYAEHLQNVIYSLALIVVMLTRPQGLLGKLKF
ncbi:MAG: branched-chain amino acid ABC transporter permease [Clostridia bacterium]|nr:branched-chain amino acid ABC transporter permease [Clostridia bacterium]